MRNNRSFHQRHVLCTFIITKAHNTTAPVVDVCVCGRDFSDRLQLICDRNNKPCFFFSCASTRPVGHLSWNMLFLFAAFEMAIVDRTNNKGRTAARQTFYGLALQWRRKDTIRRINQRQRNSEFTLNYIMVNVIANEHAVRTSLTRNMNVTNCRRHGWVNATVRWVFLCTCAHIVSLRIGTLLSLACCLGILS